MEENQQQIASNWQQFLQSFFEEIIKERHAIVKKHFDFISENKQKLTDKNDYKAWDNSKQAVFEFIKNKHAERPKLADTSFEDDFGQFIDASGEVVNSLPDILIKEQHYQRFQIQQNDGLFIKLGKPFKIAIFYLSSIPIYFLNIFRKNKKRIPYWKHQIPCKQLFERHFIVGSYVLIEQLIQQINTEFSKSLEQVKDFEKFFDPEKKEENSIVEIGFQHDFTQSIKGEINDWYLQACNTYELEYELVGTMEYKKRKLSKSHVFKHHKQAKKEIEKVCHNWNNTIHALFEDWRSELELSALQAFSQYSVVGLLSNAEEWEKKISDNYLSQIDTFLAEAQESFSDKDGNEVSLSKKITQVNYITKKRLDESLLQEMEELLSKNTLLNQLDRLEYLIAERIEKLANAYVVTKNNKFDTALSDSDLSYISNYELLSFEIQPKQNESIESLKSYIFKKMGEMLVLVGDIDEIVHYVLSTASNSLEKESNEEEARSIIIDGFERAENASKEVAKQLTDTLKFSRESLLAISKDLVDELQALKENENVSSLKLRINKAKAFHRSEAVTLRVKAYILHSFKQAKKIWLVYYHKALQLKNDLSKRYLSSAVSLEPNREVSDFLNESTQIIDQLPVIYKRLYAIEPLNDLVLFEGRKKEIQKLTKAYEAWNDGRYAAVLLTAEKWSGVTSLINYTIKNIKFHYGFVRFEFIENNVEPDHLYHQLSQLFDQKFQDTEEVINFLNEGNKRIIILENLQKLFLRELHGQRALTELINIITATQRHVFWIASMSVYTFNYLEKSLKMSAFFSYHIPLEQLSADEISQLIIKRNRVSGFKIEFETTALDRNDKKYQRLTAEQQQQFLKDRFFKALNSFAKSNISMALMYWLFSTKEVSDQNIIIRNFNKPDFSFLLALKMDRVFVLQSLIMHDGLTTEQVAKVLSYSLQKTKFLILELLEDGVIIAKKNQYLVNPIIYRNTVQLLKTKNLL